MQPPSSPALSQGPVRAAGGVLWRGTPDAPQIAVIYRPRRDDWTLPKGKLDKGETEIEAAVREVFEETGQRVRLGRHLGGVRYDITLKGKTRRKLVSYWAMQAGEGEFTANSEVDELRWLAPDDAYDLLSRDTDQDVLERFMAGPLLVGRVLLMRHAEAEAPTVGPDEARALNAVGRARAARLAAVVQVLAPESLRCSPARRCVDTLQPAAERLGIDAQAEQLFGEGGGDTTKVAEVLEERGRAGEAVLVCSHAPVIVRVLERFAAERPELLARPARLDAGGIWAADFGPQGLVGLSYLPPPHVD